MFGKLIKHEFRASGRIMLPLLIALPALGLLSNLAVHLIDSGSSIVRFLSGFILFAYGTACFCLSFAAFVVMILRWYRSVHSTEGYLTNTLPVSVHGIIWSRLLVAAVYFALSIIALVLSVMLMDLSRELFVSIGEFVSQLMQLEIQDLEREFVTLGLIAAGIVLIYAVAKCLHFYAAISVGHAFNGHKGLMSVLAYVAMQVIFSSVAVKSAMLLSEIPALSVDTVSGTYGFLACGLLGVVLYGAVCYFITVFAVKRKLNLE